jgi:hypothetical protein
MKFNSVKEYFSRLDSIAYQLMMVPLIIFILNYAQSLVDLSFLKIIPSEWSDISMAIVYFLLLVVLTIVQIKSRLEALKISREVGLGLKLEKFGDVMIRKMRWLALVTCITTVYLLFSAEWMANAGFAISFCWFILQWPTPQRTSRMLKLKGDEREMVITKGEAFR